MRSTSSTSSVRGPNWYNSADALAYGDDCRAKCQECHGHGSPYFFELLACDSCMRGPNNICCPAHICRTCHGSGFVCPQCRGMRFVRSLVFNPGAAAHQNVRELLRCPGCTEGNNIHPEQERRAIERYLMKYRTWQTAAAARGESFIEPSVARQLAADAAQVAEQQRYEARQAERRQTRQRRAITRSRQIEARLDEGMPQSPPPSDAEWSALHGIVSKYRKPGKRGA